MLSKLLIQIGIGIPLLVIGYILGQIGLFQKNRRKRHNLIRAILSEFDEFIREFCRYTDGFRNAYEDEKVAEYIDATRVQAINAQTIVLHAEDFMLLRPECQTAIHEGSRRLDEWHSHYCSIAARLRLEPLTFGNSIEPHKSKISHAKDSILSMLSHIENEVARRDKARLQELQREVNRANI